MSACELGPVDDPWRVETDVRPLLTAREWEVVRTVAQGATNREASRTLFLSEKTIEMHLTRVYRKLRIRSRCQLAVLYAQRASVHSSPQRP